MLSDRFRLMVDADEFWQQLQRDIASAQHRVWLQTLSFEGDAAGKPLAAALIASGATDRRMLVDAWSEHVLSDRFIYSPRNRMRPELRAEISETRAMMKSLRSAGVRTGITNPPGFIYHRLPGRDHRKLILIDDNVAYIGGINFSEHNFAWHDLMIRIDDMRVAELLRADFEATWSGRPVHSRGKWEGIELYNMSGQDNESECEPILDVIRSARSSIMTITPYLTFPFTDAMAEASARGAHVTVLSPAINNRKSHGHYVRRLARKHGFELRHYLGRMSHLKAMLIDDEKLIVGSTNFDWPTYYILAETAAIITDSDLVADFRRRVVDVDMAASVPVDGISTLAGQFNGWYAGLQHRFWAAGSRMISRPRDGKRVRF